MEVAKESGVQHQEIVETLTKPTEVADVTGTVKLADDAEICLIPTPSADPRGETIETLAGCKQADWK